MDGRRRRSVQEAFDLVIGFFGFFAVAFCIITLITEILRQDALGWAITTLVLALCATGAWLVRREVLRRIDLRNRLELEED